MKKSFPIFLLLALITSILFGQERQIFDPKLSPLQRMETKIGIVDVVLEYSRPSMRGRKIFGDLVPYNQLWRTGANVNTRVSFSGSVLVGDHVVPAGTYTIFTKPGQEQWDVLLHTELNTYGVPDTLTTANIVAQLSTTPYPITERTVETLTLSFDNLTTNSATFSITWENTYVPIPIRALTGEVLENTLARERMTLMEDYRCAANIYFQIEGKSEEALQAINQSIALLLDGQPFDHWLENVDLADRHLPNKFRLKSEILADLGHLSAAMEFAELSLEIARKVDDDYYINRNLENLDQWKRDRE